MQWLNGLLPHFKYQYINILLVKFSRIIIITCIVILAFQCFLLSQNSETEYECYTLAKSYMDVEEYDRAAYFTRSCTSPKAYFIHIYSRYLAGEKRKVDDAGDQTGKPACGY